MWEKFEEVADYELKNPEITEIEPLGKGVFATVISADYKKDGEIIPVAIKKIRPKAFADVNFEYEVKMNVFLLKEKVENIAKFYGFYIENPGWLMFELLDCTLAQKIRPVICGFYLIQQRQVTQGVSLKFSCYLLLDHFKDSGSFFHYDSQKKTMTTIPVTEKQYKELQSIYRTKIHRDALLSRDQLRGIEEISGHILAKKDGLSYQQLQQVFLQLISTLTHLAALRIVHGDLKPENLLLTAKGDLKLGDFGTSFHLEDPPECSSGSPYYMAPEVMDNWFNEIAICANTPASDLYSFSILLYCAFVIYEEYPYQEITDEEDLHSNVVIEKGRPPFPAYFNDPILQDIIQRAWAHDSANRPTAATLGDMLEKWIEATKPSPDLAKKIPIESENKGSSDRRIGYSQNPMRTNLFFKPKPLVVDPVVSDYSSGLWK